MLKWYNDVCGFHVHLSMLMEGTYNKKTAVRGAVAVKPGGLSTASAAPDDQSEVSAVEVAEAMRKTKKKLQQIEH